MTQDELDRLRQHGDTPAPLFHLPGSARHVHQAIARLADEQSPMGVDARKVLDDLDAAWERVARLEAEVEEMRRYRTLGVIPPRPWRGWVNPMLPREVHEDYRHLDGPAS